MIGKPYSGKPNVRFDEGELEIELSATTPALYSTDICEEFATIVPFAPMGAFDFSRFSRWGYGFFLLARNCLALSP